VPSIDFYRGLLARLPDDGGFNFWSGASAPRSAGARRRVTIRGRGDLERLRALRRYIARAAPMRSTWATSTTRSCGAAATWRRAVLVDRSLTGTRSGEQVRVEFRNSAEFPARVPRSSRRGASSRRAFRNRTGDVMAVRTVRLIENKLQKWLAMRRAILPKVVPPKPGRSSEGEVSQALLQAALAAPSGAGRPVAGKDNRRRGPREDLKCPVIWLHLDSGDAEPLTFFHFLRLATLRALHRAPIAGCR
jgi:hypothetical protein